MDDKNSIELFSEMIQNAKSTTERHRPAFFGIFSHLVNTLNRVSRVVQNKNLRISFFLLKELSSPLRASCEYTFQSKIKEQLERSIPEAEKQRGVKEIALDASQSISIYVVSNLQGPDIIDTGRLEKDLEDFLRNLEAETRAVLLSRITGSIRDIYDEFVEEESERILNLYLDILPDSEESWSKVHDIIRDQIMRRDKKAIPFKRSG